MATYRLSSLASENHLLPWPPTMFSGPYLLMSTWTATVATVFLMLTFFAQITAVILMTDPTVNIRELVWSDESRASAHYGRRND
ncbi:hypothetical protein JTE90_022175 [Oedothorax gibbosus]|uniref:Uncharacterized protein n=1 Tax=Oedothorax gibbosus TaxID=931172 RepID=A0AAV6VRD2_9ARAC|nr:hypothetical protein JTE90_022175 [Oedothorax gibbosus]